MASTLYETPEADQGEWRLWRHDTQTGKPIRFRIRRIPPEVDRQILAKHGARKKVRQVGQEKLSAFGLRQEAIIRDRAAFAALEPEGFEIIPGDPAAAALLGEDAKVGEVFTVDGRWSDAALKQRLLVRMPRLAGWIAEKADEMAGQDAEEESEAEPT